MNFTKLHGAGNDYVFIDARGKDHDWSELAVSMSDRHKGIGSDGIILAASSSVADLRMIMFNADGSRGLMCGNGIRCLVRFAFDESIIDSSCPVVGVETDSGVKQVTPIWEDGKMVRAKVGMGEPILKPEHIPVIAPNSEVLQDYELTLKDRVLNISCVSMGNPHAICFMDVDLNSYELDKIGPIVELHEMFPERVNFEIARLVDSSNIEVRVWERGSGLTEACGTGACAVAVSARLHGFIGDHVTVHLPGGDLSIDWSGQGEVVMEGPVESVFKGQWPL